MQSRLDEEATIAARYGNGSLAFIRGALNELSRPGMRNRVLLVFCAFALQNLSGASAINYYSPTLFGSLGVTDIPLYTGIYGLVKAVASIIYYIFFIDVVCRSLRQSRTSCRCHCCWCTFVGIHSSWWSSCDWHDYDLLHLLVLRSKRYPLDCLS